jgi:hypothetical protein
LAATISLSSLFYRIENPRLFFLINETFFSVRKHAWSSFKLNITGRRWMVNDPGVDSGKKESTSRAKRLPVAFAFFYLFSR